jgi:hypothetical protein
MGACFHVGKPYLPQNFSCGNGELFLLRHKWGKSAIGAVWASPAGMSRLENARKRAHDPRFVTQLDNPNIKYLSVYILVKTLHAASRGGSLERSETHPDRTAGKATAGLAVLNLPCRHGTRASPNQSQVWKAGEDGALPRHDQGGHNQGESATFARLATRRRQGATLGSALRRAVTCAQCGSRFAPILPAQMRYR